MPWTLAKNFYADLRGARKAWSEDHATRLASSLAYYTLLSLAPMLILAIALAGLFLGEEAARNQIATQVMKVTGEEAGRGIQQVILHADKPGTTGLSSVIGGVVLLFGASGVFGELQAALNTIWHVEPRPGRGFWGVVRDRFTSFTMVLSVAFVLLVSLLLSTLLSALGNFFSHSLPGGAFLWTAVNFGLSILVISALFAAIFKIVPDIEISYRDVWSGAVLTALLFTLGKTALGLYLGHSSLASPYGAAGSIIVLVVWVYYSAQILFFGAEFTRVSAQRRGFPVKAAKQARPVDEQGPPPLAGAHPGGMAR
jgi:membrane protein